MQSFTLADEILSLASEYDKLKVTENAEGKNKRRAQIETLLTGYMGETGMKTVLSVCACAMRSDLNQTEREGRALLIRHKLVADLLALQHPKQANAGLGKDGKDLAFRPRMKKQQSDAQHLHRMTPRIAWFRTGTAYSIFGLLVLAFLGLTMLMLFSWLKARIDHSTAVMTMIVVGAIIYGTAAIVVWRYLRAWLTSLIEPGPGIHQLRPALMAGHVASALVGGMTIILAVLAFDYFVHTAAADADGAKEKTIADIAAAHKLPWHIVAPLSSGKATPALQGEDFGRFAGTFGDFFGGVVNPVLTFGTLIALLITLLMQRTQLAHEKHRASEAANVSNLQVFETTFFNLLNLHSETIPGLRFSANSLLSEAALNSSGNARNEDDDAVSGRAVFSAVMDTIHETPDLSGRGTIGDRQPEENYKFIQEQQNHLLGHYFRNLFQVLAYVDRHPVMLAAEGVGEEYRARKRYTNILRAQLSSHELCLLFFNCAGNLVDRGAFRRMLVEWEMLEHIPLRYDADKRSLYIEGFKKYPVDHIISQYLGDVGVDQHPAGAFGSHPVVVDYLIMSAGITGSILPKDGVQASEPAQS